MGEPQTLAFVQFLLLFLVPLIASYSYGILPNIIIILVELLVITIF